MANPKKRSYFGLLLDTITFPLRALFLATEGKAGLSSLRDERMRMVAAYCKGKTLDIGCGPGNTFVNQFIGPENGVGIDVFPYQGVENVVEDLAKIPFADSTFDTITLIAVGGHIPKSKRVSEFKEFARLLKPDGIILMTEGEPITQYLSHKWRAFACRLQNKLDMDSERGMEADEEYCMPVEELIAFLNTPPLRFVLRKKFLTQWGLNNLYVAKKAEE